MMRPVALMVAAPAMLPVFSPTWRQQCKRCRHVEVVLEGGGNEVLRCRHPSVPATTRAVPAYCIDAREAQCSPLAALWEAAG